MSELRQIDYAVQRFARRVHGPRRVNQSVKESIDGEAGRSRIDAGSA